MDTERIEKLIEVSTGAANEALRALYEAWRKKFDEWKLDSSKQKLAEWQAAEKALKSKAEEFASAHSELDASPLESLTAVHVFLTGYGYKVSKRKVYLDADKGLIKVNPDRSVNESEARAYAERYLKKVKSGSGDGDGRLDQLYREKAEADLKNIQMKNDQIEFEIEKQKGLWLKREEAETLLAVKLGALDAAVKDLIRTRALDWLYSAAGDSKKLEMLVELMTADVDMMFNGLAEIEELELVVMLPGVGGNDVEINL